MSPARRAQQIHPPPMDLNEDYHPRDATLGYYTQTAASWDNDGQTRIPHDADTFRKAGIRASVLHVAAADDGAIRVYDTTTGEACTPEITIPQNATTIIDTEVTLPEGASGTVILRVDTKSGEATKTIRLYGGGTLREVRA